MNLNFVLCSRQNFANLTESAPMLIQSLSCDVRLCIVGQLTGGGSCAVVVGATHDMQQIFFDIFFGNFLLL